MSNWNPQTHPYRALIILNTNAPGCYGWRAEVRGTFATAEEAQAALTDLPRNTRYAAIDRATKNAWKRVKTIKPAAPQAKLQGGK